MHWDRTNEIYAGGPTSVEGIKYQALTLVPSRLMIR